jgi:hypothetical protein
MKPSPHQTVTRFAILVIVIAIVVYIAVSTEKRTAPGAEPALSDTLFLFTSTAKDAYTIVLKDSLANPDSTFFMKDGMLYSPGTPFGYIRTNTMYSDYHLLVEWRWPAEPSNSGVFLHINEDAVWPVCLECQLKSGRAGDFVAFPGVTFKQHLNPDKLAVPAMNSSSEKPAGEWNLYDIRVQNDSVSIYVNGVLQNIASGMNLTKGYIALQSEGGPVLFRNVRLIPLVKE